MNFLRGCLSNLLFYLVYFAGIHEAYVIIMKDMCNNQVADMERYCQLFVMVFNKGQNHHEFMSHDFDSCSVNNVQEAAQHSLPVSALTQAVQ